MALHRRGDHWYGDFAADMRVLLARKAGDPVKVVRDVVCDCGGTVFSVLTDDEYQKAAWFCRACGAQYLFHTERVPDPYEGAAGADAEYVHCECADRGGSCFELAVGVTLYDGGEDVDWVFLVCRCVACGLTGYLAEWHRIEYPYEELFAHLRKSWWTSRPEPGERGRLPIIRFGDRRALRRGQYRREKTAMPPHSLDQAYGHVVEAAARNVRRLVAAADLSHLEVEAEHLAHVADLLDRYLLHGRYKDPRFDQAAHAVYWHRIRPAYIAQAEPASVKGLESAWDCLLYIIDLDEWDRQRLEPMS